jgi:hypothetical protein
MTVNELFEKLEFARSQGFGELPVVIEADHGQTPMHSSWAGVDAVMKFWNNCPNGPSGTFNEMYDVGFLKLPENK